MAKAWFTLFKLDGAIKAMETELAESTEVVKRAVTGYEYTTQRWFFFKRTHVMPDFETWKARRHSISRYNIEYALSANDKEMEKHFRTFDFLPYQIESTKKYAEMAKKSSEQKVFLDFYEYSNFKGWII